MRDRVPFNARLSLRQVASIARYFEASGIRVHSRSQLIHLIVDTFYGLLVKKGLSEPVDTVDEAAVLFRRIGIDFDNAQTKAIIKALEEEDIDIEFESIPEKSYTIEDYTKIAEEILKKSEEE